MRKLFHYFCILILLFSTFLTFKQTSFAAVPYEASDVLGQSDFVSSSTGTSSTTLYQPYGTLVDTVDHRLFIMDGFNHRLLVFNLNENNELVDKTADYVLGQPDFDSNESIDPPTINSVDGAYAGLAYDYARKRLFISEYNSNRVTVFLLANGITNNMDASYVLGQPNFVSRVQNLTQNGMDQPSGIAFDPDTDYLYVSEYANNRITVFNVAPNNISNGMNASYVIGQFDFETRDSSCTAHGLDYQWPIAIDVENKRLFVGDGDSGNHGRVLVFDIHSIVNGMDAVHVLGHSTFDDCTYQSATQSSLYYPYNGIVFDSYNQLLYVDHADGFKRMTVYDVNEITNGEDAVAVIGQSDFTSNTDAGVTISSISGTYQGTIAFDEVHKRMFYPDTQHNRVLIFNFVKLPTSISTPSVGSSYTQSLAATQSQGTVSYEVTSGSLPIGLSLNTITGAITGTPTTTGSYTFTIKATDDNGAIGYFFDTQEYTLTVSGSGGGGSSPRPEGEYSTTEAPICRYSSPLSAPNLFNLQRNGKDVALYFTPIPSNTSYYFISYGTDTTAEGYSLEIPQPIDTTGAITQDIHMLNPNKTYYFKVRAGNNCMPGPWSSVVK